jgi:hypothetical protein
MGVPDGNVALPGHGASGRGVFNARPPRITSAGLIYATLLAEIVSLQLPPGTPLQEKMLVERFCVSRTPVREAMLRLAEMGLVDIFPQSGTFVSRVPVNAIPEAVLVRQALEGITVAAAARSMRADGASRLDAAIARQRLMNELGDLGGFHEADEAFHAEIAAIGGHPGICADRPRPPTDPAGARSDEPGGRRACGDPRRDRRRRRRLRCFGDAGTPRRRHP